MKKISIRHATLAALALISISVSGVFAFQSQQKVSVKAGVFIGGSTGSHLQIHHTPLPAGSLVTKQFILIGEAGTAIPNPPPPLSQRLTPASDFGPIENRKMRITVQYRFLTPEQVQGTVPLPDPSVLPVVEGPDPTAFAFQIPSSSFSVTTPVLQYKIIAEQLSYTNGQLIVVNTISFPSASSSDGWVTVGAAANAANTFDIEGGRLVLPDGNPLDGESSIDIPQGALSGATVITLNEVPSGSPLIPNQYPGGVRYYQATADRQLSETAQVTLLYPDFEFPTGANGIVDGTDIPVQNLGVFVWDGFTWRRLGGVIDTHTNTIRAKVPFFGFFVIAASAPLTPEGRRPMEKIITPNGDGINDVATFSVDNLTEDYKIDIYDITGHRVRSLSTGSTLTWDGRDESGKIVESGVYIYQYEVDGKRVSGFIAVAK